jgi:phage baseplate assembly protein V
VTARARSRSTDQRFYGVFEGLVEENEDPESEGRVKLRFPWYSDTEVTDWCRVSQLYAGPDYGSLFVPEVGDEVLVCFVHGDMRLPVVLGGLYNGEDKPPSARTSSVDEKMIRTKAGHEILLADTSGAELVKVETQGGHIVTLDDAGGLVTVETSSGNVVQMDDGAGRIAITALSKITLEAPEIDITGDTSVNVRGGQIALN